MRWRIVIDTPDLTSTQFRMLLEGLVSVLRQYPSLSIRFEKSHKGG